MPLLLCNGMNRAGSTLQYNLARGLVEGAGIGRGEGYILDADVPDAVPRLAAWAADDAWHVVKLHRLPPNAATLLANGRTHLCYIYRDIRAVAASYRRVWGFDGKRLDAELDRAVATYDAVHALGNAILWQRYEEVVVDLETAARQIARYCQWPVATSLLLSVATANVPANMRRHQRQFEADLARVPLSHRARSLRRRILRRFGLWRPQRDHRRKRALDPTTLLHPGHISATAARPNAWREQLPPEEIERLTIRYSVWLGETGYLETAAP